MKIPVTLATILVVGILLAYEVQEIAFRPCGPLRMELQPPLLISVRMEDGNPFCIDSNAFIDDETVYDLYNWCRGYPYYEGGLDSKVVICASDDMPEEARQVVLRCFSRCFYGVMFKISESVGGDSCGSFACLAKVPTLGVEKAMPCNMKPDPLEDAISRVKIARPLVRERSRRVLNNDTPCELVLDCGRLVYLLKNGSMRLLHDFNEIEVRDDDVKEPRNILSLMISFIEQEGLEFNDEDIINIAVAVTPKTEWKHLKMLLMIFSSCCCEYDEHEIRVSIVDGAGNVMSWEELESR